MPAGSARAVESDPGKQDRLSQQRRQKNAVTIAYACIDTGASQIMTHPTIIEAVDEPGRNTGDAVTAVIKSSDVMITVGLNMTRQTFAVLAAVSVLLGSSYAWAQELVGCDKFRWDVTRERAALSQTNVPKLASGSDLTGALPQTVILDLKPAAEAKLPSPPERAPKPDTFAGFSTVKNIPANGVYSLSLSGSAWVDVLQNGSFLKPKVFSGVTGCDGIRKTIKFDLIAGPAIIQISGVSEPAIKMAIVPVIE